MQARSSSSHRKFTGRAADLMAAHARVTVKQMIGRVAT